MVYGKTIPQSFLSISHETTCDGTLFTNTDFIEIFFYHRCFPVNFEAFSRLCMTYFVKTTNNS